MPNLGLFERTAHVAHVGAANRLAALPALCGVQTWLLAAARML